MALLPNGRVLIISGSENDPSVTTRRASVLTLATGTFTIKELGRDLFCNAMSFLPNGRVLIVGGTKTYDPFTGEGATTIYDWVTGEFVAGPEMAEGRWYPTNTVLSDGKTLTISGIYDTEVNNTTEIFSPSGPLTGTWSAPVLMPFVPPLYPRAHLMPDRRVFYSGSNSNTHFFNPDTSEWSDGPVSRYGDRTYGTSVLLPLSPENGYMARVMIFGGGTPPANINEPLLATNTAEIFSSENPTTWQDAASMTEARIQLNGTLLPNGEVLATGGSKENENPSTASLSAEIYNPNTNTWTTGASETKPRLYHSVAILLPDGRVLSAGSNPVRGEYDPSIEIYSPPYLFTRDATGAVISAPRPVIGRMQGRISYGGAFSVGVQSGAGVSSVILMRLGAVTHSFNMEQRAVWLNFSSLPNGTMSVIAPPNGAIAPPGYYLLFVNDSKGVPSVAKIVRLVQ